MMNENTSNEENRRDHSLEVDPDSEIKEKTGEMESKKKQEEAPTPESASFILHLSRSLRLLLICIVICSAAYPALLLMAGAVFWSDNARGGIVRLDGKPVGARLIGQSFHSEKFFHPRPSSKGYDGMNSGSQNLGPYNEALAERVSERLNELEQQGISAETVPVGWVTESGSALDPHITPATARLQAPRVSLATGLPKEELETMIERCTEGEFLGFYGQERVNVLILNLNIQKRLGESQ